MILHQSHDYVITPRCTGESLAIIVVKESLLKYIYNIKEDIVVEECSDSEACIENMVKSKTKTRKSIQGRRNAERLRSPREAECRDQRYPSIAESISDGMITFNSLGKVVLWNQAAIKIFGYSPAEMLGKSFNNIVPRRFRGSHLKALKRLATGHKSKFLDNVVEMVGLRKGNVEFPMELSLTKWRTGEGVFFTAVTRDISGRKQVEEKLRVSENRYRQLLENLQEGIWVIDKEAHTTFVNRPMADMLGYTPNEMLGKHLFSFMDERGVEIAKIDLERRQQGIKEQHEFEFIRKDGTRLYALLETSPILDNDGNYNGALAGILDITGRKQAEEMIKDREEKFRSLVESTSDWIWEIDNNNIYTYSSPKVMELLGYSPEEVMGKTPFDFMSTDEAHRVAEKLNTIIADGKPFERIENTNLHKDGHLVILETSGVPVFDVNGKLRGYRGVDRDVTQQKKMLDSLTIADRLAALGNMAGGFAHELNNPLTGVIGYAQLLLDRKDLSEDVRKDLTGIHEEAQRAAETIKNFMTFALKRPFQKQPCDINEFIRDTLKLRKYEQKKNKTSVKTNFEPDLPQVIAGPTRLRQVFMDIITNAEYFMWEAHKKGTLIIATAKDGDVVKASFTDDGPGILPENIRQIFNPFFTTKEVGQGVGLGLSICHRIITDHGGRIYVESEPGKGATFIVELPAAKE